MNQVPPLDLGSCSAQPLPARISTLRNVLMKHTGVAENMQDLSMKSSSSEALPRQPSLKIKGGEWVDYVSSATTTF